MKSVTPAFICLILLLGAVHPVWSAAQKPTDRLLGELRQLAQESREKQAADRWLQRALDDLVARYERPWQRTLLFEDFNDGDYTRNPAWQLLEGRFEVIRGQGLVGHVDTAASPADSGTTPPATGDSAREDLAGALVGAFLNQAFGPKPAPSQSDQAPVPPSDTGPNVLRLKAGVSNAFALTASIRLGAGAETRFEIALLQSQQGRYGYRLHVDTSGKGRIELERIRKGRGSIVESRPLNASLADGRLHDLTWRQAPDGTVSVLIDEQPVFSVRDRAFRDGYPWLELRQSAGDLSLRSLRIEGT